MLFWEIQWSFMIFGPLLESGRSELKGWLYKHG